MEAEQVQHQQSLHISIRIYDLTQCSCMMCFVIITAPFLLFIIFSFIHISSLHIIIKPSILWSGDWVLIGHKSVLLFAFLNCTNAFERPNNWSHWVKLWLQHITKTFNMTCLKCYQIHCMVHAVQLSLICIKIISLWVTDPLWLDHHGVIIWWIITVDSKYFQCPVSESHSGHEMKHLAF